MHKHDLIPIYSAATKVNPYILHLSRDTLAQNIIRKRAARSSEPLVRMSASLPHWEPVVMPTVPLEEFQVPESRVPVTSNGFHVASGSNLMK